MFMEMHLLNTRRCRDRAGRRFLTIRLVVEGYKLYPMEPEHEGVGIG